MAEEGVRVTVMLNSDGTTEHIKLEEPERDTQPNTAIEFSVDYLENENEIETEIQNNGNCDVEDGAVDPLMQQDDGQTQSTEMDYRESVPRTEDDTETECVKAVKIESTDRVEVTVEDFQHTSFQEEQCQIQSNSNISNRPKGAGEIALIYEGKNSLLNPLLVILPASEVIQENPTFLNEIEESPLTLDETNPQSIQSSFNSAVESVISSNSNLSTVSAHSSRSTTPLVAHSSGSNTPTVIAPTPSPAPSAAPAVPKPAINSRRSKLFCLPCDLLFKTQQELDEHLMTDHLYAFGCEVCNAYFTNKRILERHEKSHKINGTYICPFCSVQIKAKYQMTAHLSEAHPIKPKMYGCTSLECELLFQNMRELLAHKLSNKHYSRPSGNTTKSWTAKCCEQIFIDYGKFKSHYDVFHQGQSIANIVTLSPTVSPSSREMNQNVSHNHYYGGSVESSETDRVSTPTQSQEISEEEMAENAAVLRQSPKCSICGATFITLVGLQSHEKKHHKTKHICPTCQMGFDNEELLYNHQMNEHRSKRNSQGQRKSSGRSASRTSSIDSNSSTSSNYSSTNVANINYGRNIATEFTVSPSGMLPMTMTISRNASTVAHQSAHSSGSTSSGILKRTLQPEPGINTPLSKRVQNLVVLTQEIERLRHWFSINPNPSDAEIILCTRELNRGGDHRERHPLTEMFVRQWFENFRNSMTNPNPVASNSDSHGLGGGQVLRNSNTGSTGPTSTPAHQYPGLSVTVNYPPGVRQYTASSSSSNYLCDPPPYSNSSGNVNFAPTGYPTLAAQAQPSQYISPSAPTSRTITFHGADQNIPTAQNSSTLTLHSFNQYQMPVQRQMQNSAGPRNPLLTGMLHSENNLPNREYSGSGYLQPIPVSHFQTQTRPAQKSQIVTNVSPWESRSDYQNNSNPFSSNNEYNSSFSASGVQQQPPKPARTWGLDSNSIENLSRLSSDTAPGNNNYDGRNGQYNQTQGEQPLPIEIEFVEPGIAPRKETDEQLLLHPVKEVAKLLLWFDLNPRPSDQTIEDYTGCLNSQSYRNTPNIPKLTTQVIKRWFKATRLSLSRIEGKRCEATTTMTPGQLPLPVHNEMQSGRTLSFDNTQQQFGSQGQSPNPNRVFGQFNMDTSHTFREQGQPIQMQLQHPDPHQEFYNVGNSSNVPTGTSNTLTDADDQTPQIVSVSSLAESHGDDEDSDQCSRVTSSQVEAPNVCKASINKYLEVPLLLRWFESTPNPSATEIAQYTIELNKSDLRKDGPFLPRIAISNFFKKLHFLRQKKHTENNNTSNNPQPSTSSATTQENQNQTGNDPEPEVVELEEDTELEVLHENIVHRNALPTSLFISTPDSNVLGPQYTGPNPSPNTIPTSEEEKQIDRTLINLLTAKPSHHALLSILNKFSQFPHMITSYGVLYNQYREQLRKENCIKHMNEIGSKCSCPINMNTSVITNDQVTSPNPSSSSIIGMDPISEIPQLELWFAIHSNPPLDTISKYTQDLNDRPYRKNRPGSHLTISSVQSWFETRKQYQTPGATFCR